MTDERQTHFQTGGAGYAQFRPAYPPALAAALADLPASPGRALDVGCGSGQLTVLLAEHFDEVLATDVSADQLANAPPHARVTYLEGPAEELVADDRSIDLVVAAQAAHWFDLDKFYAEARRVARAGAVIALVTYGKSHILGDEAVETRYQRFYQEEIGPYWPSERRHVERGYADLAFPFERVTIPAQEIAVDWDLAAVIGYAGTWSATKKAAKAGAAHLLPAFEADMARLWGDPATPRRVVWPITVRAGRLTAI